MCFPGRACPPGLVCLFDSSLSPTLNQDHLGVCDLSCSPYCLQGSEQCLASRRSSIDTEVQVKVIAWELVTSDGGGWTSQGRYQDSMLVGENGGKRQEQLGSPLGDPTMDDRLACVLSR